jgi:hypothetical protein
MYTVSGSGRAYLWESDVLAAHIRSVLLVSFLDKLHQAGMLVHSVRLAVETATYTHSEWNSVTNRIEPNRFL